MKRLFVSLILITIFILTACSGSSLEHAYTSLGYTSTIRTGGAELIATEPNTPEPSAVLVARSANDFAFRLSAVLAEDIGDENFVVSPFSLWMPIIALTNAVPEENQRELLESLGLQDVELDKINQGVSRMLFDLTNERAKRQGVIEEDTLHIANAVFIGNEFTLRREFAGTFMDFYRGDVMGVDFLSPETVEIVNRWAYDNTNGRIPSIVGEFDPDTVAVIGNAIYFSDDWLFVYDDHFHYEFTPAGVRTFFSPNEVNTADFMQLEKPNFTYFEDEWIQAVNLPFSTGGGLKIILPKDGDAVGFLSSMTNEYFDIIKRESVTTGGRLILPQFFIDNDVDNLMGVLRYLEIPIFDGSMRLSRLIEEDARIMIDNVIQKAMIEVDEEGMTAAAVTLIGMIPVSLPLRPEFEIDFVMNCNSPFAFILHGYTTDGGKQVLFTGVVNQP